MTTTGPRSGGSRFFASQRCAPRSRNPRPANRVAGQKTAPRNFFSAPPTSRPEIASQTLGTHQANYVWAYDFAPGCAVAPNRGGLSPAIDGENGSILRKYSNTVKDASGLVIATDYLYKTSPEAVAKAVMFMSKNSSSMRGAVQAAIEQGAVLVPVEGATGGVQYGKQIQFGIGTIVTTRTGSDLYPMYTAAHEFGHYLDYEVVKYSATFYRNRDWVHNEFANNEGEAFAVIFANTVSSEIRASAGIDIGTAKNYYHTYNKTTSAPGSLMPGF